MFGVVLWNFLVLLYLLLFFFRRCSVVYDVAFPPYESFLFFSSSSFHLLWNKIIILFFSSCYIYRWEIIFENWYNKFYYGCFMTSFCSWNKVSSLVFSFFFFNEKLIIIQYTIYSRVVQILFRGQLWSKKRDTNII